MTTAAGITLPQFLQAEQAQESGGNYSAVSPAGALGRWQVMPANVGPWSQQFLGHVITPAQFLADPAAQDTIATGKLTQLYNAYGPRGAAAAWYSGDPSLANSTAPQPGGPSISAYVDQVLAKAGGASTTGPSVQTASTGSGMLPGIPGLSGGSLGSLLGLPSIPWLRLGLGLLGGVVILIGLWVTFSSQVPEGAKAAVAAAVA